VLEGVPHDRSVRLDLDGVKGMDHTTAQAIGEWLARRRKRGTPSEVAGSDELLRPLAITH